MGLQYKKYLLEELPKILAQLKAEQEPNFGLMNGHHMVEHLIYTTKSLPKNHGEPTGEPTKSELFFKKFLSAGLPFQHKPREGVTKKDLKEIRTASLEEAIETLTRASAAFYELAAANPEHKSYNPMTGSFNIEQIETFLAKHAQYHCFQFGLIDAYEPVAV